MYKVFDNLVPTTNVIVSHLNSVSVSEYPEYNLPALEVPNLADPVTTSQVAVSEIYDLFNATRLGGMESDIVESIRSNILASSPFSEAISKLSDDEILDSIKPRNIQSPSQLVSWSKYLQAVISDRIESANLNSSESNNPVDEPAASSTEPIN